MPTSIATTADSIRYSFTQAFSTFLSFLPTLLGAIIVLAIGWVISTWVARLLEKGLQMAGLERAAALSGVQSFIVRSGAPWSTSGTIALLAKWFIRLIFLQAAANLLNMPQITEIVNSILYFIPKLAIALVIVALGAMAAKFLAGIVRGSVSKLESPNPEYLAKLTQYSILGFAIVAAISQLGVAPVIVHSLFIAFVASIALATGIAFGLGGRDVAGEITRGWYQRGKTLASRRPLGVAPLSNRESESRRLPPTGTNTSS